jgi:hypothetical protein
LHHVVTYGTGCAQRFLNVFRPQFNTLSFLFERCPNPRQTVGLQFDGNIQFGCALLVSRLQSVNLIFNAQYKLHVVAHLMREHVGLCEATGCVVLSFEFAKEVQI